MINAFIFLVNLVSSLGFLAILIAGTLGQFAVKGSASRYQASSVIVTLFWPVVIASVFAAVISISTEQLFTATMDIVRIIISGIYWFRHKDEDNWWTGRGKKMLDGIDKFIEKMTPSVAGAGA